MTRQEIEAMDYLHDNGMFLHCFVSKKNIALKDKFYEWHLEKYNNRNFAWCDKSVILERMGLYLMSNFPLAYADFVAYLNSQNEVTIVEARMACLMMYEFIPRHYNNY